jgi:nucleotide-binding universal stress UspA family protein
MDGPVIVGTDGSETADRAVNEAVQMAVRFDQPLHIVCAYKPQQVTTAGLPEEFRYSVTPHVHVDGLLDDAGARARQAGAKVETHAIPGDPADALLDLSESIGAGLIVIGNRGISSAKRFVLGNVPSKVVHHATCSTYVVQTT